MAQDAKKPYTLHQAPELKTVYGMLVCGVCGAPVKRRTKSDGTERWYCEADYHHIPATLTDEELLEKLQGVLAYMAETPESIICETHTAEHNDIAIARLESEINAMLDRASDNIDEMLGMILRLAADKYASVNGVSAESKRIQETLKCQQKDIRILPEIADSIAISPKTVISISLKNGQNISEGESDI